MENGFSEKIGKQQSIDDFEQHLRKLCSNISTLTKQWNTESSNIRRLLRNLCAKRVNFMELHKKKQGSNDELGCCENQKMSISDVLLHDSEQLTASFTKFSIILDGIRQTTSKMIAFRELIAPNLHLLSRVDEIVEQLGQLEWMFERELAFRKNSLLNFALTDGKDVFSLIEAAWKHDIYIDHNTFSSQFV